MMSTPIEVHAAPARTDRGHSVETLVTMPEPRFGLVLARHGQISEHVGGALIGCTSPPVARARPSPLPGVTCVRGWPADR